MSHSAARRYTFVTGSDPVAKVWRRWLRLRFRLFQRGRHDALVLEQVAGFQILVLPGVFNPKLFWTGELLASTLDDESLIPPGSSVLDLGTGTGIAALAAARRGAQVVAVDVNPAAVRCARINALLNELDHRVEVREGDLFAPVSERFDVILFNPPYYPGTPRDPLDRAFRAADLPQRFARALAAHLDPNGFALVLLSSTGDESFLSELRSAGLRVETETERRRIGEVLTVYRVSAC
jgi:release factor glutamine methyltransferase